MFKWLAGVLLGTMLAFGQVSSYPNSGGGGGGSVTPAGSSGDWQTNNGGTALGSIAANGVSVGLTASISGNTLTIACPSTHTCSTQQGGTTTSMSSLSTTVTPGTGSYTWYVYILLGTLYYGHNGTAPSCGAGISCASGITDWPAGSIHLFSGTVTSNNFVGDPVNRKPYAVADPTITSATITTTRTSTGWQLEASSSYDPLSTTKAYRETWFYMWGAGYPQTFGWAFSGTCGSVAAITDSTTGFLAYGIQGGAVCYVYMHGNGGSTGAFADPVSGSNPKASGYLVRASRSTGAGTANAYWGWSASITTVSNYIGIRYNHSAGQFQCVKRTGGADVQSSNIMATDTSFHNFLVEVTAANTVKCTIDSTVVTLDNSVAIATGQANWWPMFGADGASTPVSPVRAVVYVGPTL